MIKHFIFVTYCSWSIRHQIFSIPGLGKGNDVTNAVGLAENGNQAVKAERDAAVGRAATGQRLEKMIQRFSVFAENSLEDVFLKVAVVYSDGTAPDFETVENLQIKC